MLIKSPLFAIVLWCISGQLSAQLSPGPLAEPHADLEGVFNCTKCHTLGEKVSDAKCLQCHELLNERINANLGYHASDYVKSKNCFQCHSDHHGRTFDMIRLDESEFDHDLTGYELLGAHQDPDCKDCHNKEHIERQEIRDKLFTYLGLSTECLSCHDDYHRGELSTNCIDCHDYQAFSPAPKFDHDQTQFKLVGAHRSVDCIQCHAQEDTGDPPYRQYSGIAFQHCTACHEDVHQGKFGTNCTDCHNQNAFNEISGRKQFDHNATNFPLVGQHQFLDCFECHDRQQEGRDMFEDYKGAAIDQCTTCHEDVHQDRFGQNCQKCHSEASFKNVPEDMFDHNLTDYPLLGKHQTVDCASCHIADDKTTPMAHDACVDCHEDYHRGELSDNNSPRDCASCHDVDGFEYTSYSIEDHNQSQFVLTGAHLATPCFVCHLQDEQRWQFRNIGTECVDCHEDIHEGFIDPKYYPKADCESCHTTEHWADINFDHDRTQFALEGKHRNVDCAACHFEQTKDQQKPIQRFKNLSMECTQCHEDVHRGQFEDLGGTQCTNCHGFDDWSASQFDHDQTQFPLEGAHANLECNACHKPYLSQGTEYILYKIKNFECIDCHGN